MAGLAVNINHIATLRNVRMIRYPDPAAAAILAELAGADGIEVHLREDRRHIQDADLKILRSVVQTKLIMKMASTNEMVGIALDIKPDVATLVPERREESTTQGGLDLIVHKNEVAETVNTFQNSGIPAGVLIDPDPDQVKIAHQIDVDLVDIHTRTFCESKTSKSRQQAFSNIVDAVKLAHKLKIGVNIGYGLCYNTIKAFKGLREIDEFSIGYSIISRAVLVGMESAVREMAALIKDL
ncbi:MAG: pyridoxine 5'-phosphate synthase [Deltaproteobacteria bacterium]|jgi:pyridoxine 5-phosphate synthase|nr:pyridoxine 5'-phosphate synthase [Deltaproteobacteria bacterium]